MSNSKSIGVAYSDQEIFGGKVDNTPVGASLPSTVNGTTVYATQELGYAAAAQGVVTQLTSKSTGVILNKSAGRITMDDAELASAAAVSFTLTNSLILAKDVVIVCISAGATAAAYTTYVSSLAAGSAVITLRNLSGAALSEAVVINFCIIHAI
jgi:catabolite regulation protein CreA